MALNTSVFVNTASETRSNPTTAFCGLIGFGLRQQRMGRTPSSGIGSAMEDGFASVLAMLVFGDTQ